MKRFYLFALCIVTALGLSANGVEIDGVYYLLDNENQTATVTYPNETAPVWNSAPSTYSGKVFIPDRVTYDGEIYTVNAIGPKAFLGTRLDSISLTVNITSIGSAAFYDHRGIHYLNLPNLTSIGNEAFRYCSSLTKVVIPECISSLGITIFQRCVSMTEITLPQSLKSLPYAFLYACSRLTEVVLPPDITAQTGMDALTHAVEAYCSRFYNTNQTRRLAETAVADIFRWLPAACENGEDLTAREKLLIASFRAGCAFTRAGVGNVHAIAHTLGGLYGVGHGLANAVLLPVILRDYGSTVAPQLGRLAEAAGIAGGADGFVDAIFAMNEKLGIPRGFSCIRTEDIPRMTAWADAEANPGYPVPVIYDREHFAEIIHRIRLE